MGMSKEFYHNNYLMRKFLRSEGWYQKKLKWDAGYPASLHWHDPKGTPYWDLWEAYQKAERRKADREARVLKKTSWIFTGRGWIRMKSIMSTTLSRTEAMEYIKTLPANHQVKQVRNGV